MEYILKINQEIKEHILSVNQKEQKKIKKTFNYLKDGHWKSIGLNVKKRKDCKYVIFQARKDKHDRVLFTIGKDNMSLIPIIYVWEIAVHDEVSEKVKIIKPDKIPFLDFNEYDAEEIFNTSDLTESDYTQESISNAKELEYPPQKWYQLNDEQWNIMFDFGKRIDIKLELTNEQKKLLTEEKCPLLLTGTAGSGKTTLSIYKLLENPKQKQLYVTYNKALKIQAEDYFKKLAKGSSVDENDIDNTKFYTFKELCFEIMKNDTHTSFDLKKEVKFDFFANKLKFQNIDLALFWTEIRGIIKGSKPEMPHYELESINSKKRNELIKIFSIFSEKITDKEKKEIEMKHKIDLDDFLPNIKFFLKYNIAETITNINKISEYINRYYLDYCLSKNNKYMLSEAEYCALGDKRLNCDDPRFRKRIYEIAKRYDSIITKDNYWDEIDLTWVALKKVVNNQYNLKFDLVCIDEIQDLTEIQTELLWRLCNSDKAIFWAGDTNQVINPSGFRWADVKKILYYNNVDRNALAPKSLTINFRCTKQITDLANEVLALKKEVFGENKYLTKETSIFNGETVDFVRANKNKVIEIIKGEASRQIILVRDDRAKNKLKKELNVDGRIFNIYEAKGLEFDTVLLYNFASESLCYWDRWDRIIKNKFTTEHELNLLYTAITRTREKLFIYENSNTVFWELNYFKKLLSSKDINDFDEKWKSSSTTEDWLKDGDYLFENEKYEQAAHSYKKAGADKKMHKAFAKHWENLMEYAKAAEHWVNSENYAEAATNYEMCEDWKNAINCWGKIGKWEKVNKCKELLAKQYEKQSKFLDAAITWNDLEQYENVWKNFSKLMNDKKNFINLYKKHTIEINILIEYLLIQNSEIHNKIKDFLLKTVFNEKEFLEIINKIVFEFNDFKYLFDSKLNTEDKKLLNKSFLEIKDKRPYLNEKSSNNLEIYLLNYNLNKLKNYGKTKINKGGKNAR